MDAYEVEVEPAEPDGFVVTVPGLPGLLVLGTSVDDVLEHSDDRVESTKSHRLGARRTLASVA